jgi:hypothetical protein
VRPHTSEMNIELANERPANAKTSKREERKKIVWLIAAKVGNP